MKLSQILSGVDYSGRIEKDVEIEDIVYDSRKAKDGVIFVCLRG